METFNEDLDVNIEWHIWVGTIIPLVAATLAVICRFIARNISSAKFGWDDWTLVVALVLNWAMAAMRWSQCLLYLYGHHVQFVSEDKVVEFWKSFLAVQILYFSDAVITKTSLLLLYYRLFGSVRKFRIAVRIAGAVVSGYFMACVITSVAGCQPVSYFWYKNQPGKCLDEVNFFRWNGVANMLTDVMILCLPGPMVWGLQMARRQKLVLIGIFLLGGFVCIVSVFRIIAFSHSDPKDPTYWSSVEQSCAIVCACLPTLRPLVFYLFPHTKTGNSNTALNLRNFKQLPDNHSPSAEGFPTLPCKLVRVASRNQSLE